MSSSGLIVAAPIAFRIARFADRVDEGAAGVLHQMPAVGDLRRLSKRSLSGKRITPTAITRDDRDLRLTGQPGLGRGGLAVRQQGDRPAPIEIANESPTTVVAAPSPVIDPNDAWGCEGRRPTSPDDAQERVVADRHHQPASEVGGRSAAERKRQTVDDPIEPPSGRDQGARISASKRSAKILRAQTASSHRKRLARRTSRTCRPDIGRSARRRGFWRTIATSMLPSLVMGWGALQLSRASRSSTQRTAFPELPQLRIRRRRRCMLLGVFGFRFPNAHILVHLPVEYLCLTKIVILPTVGQQAFDLFSC